MDKDTLKDRIRSLGVKAGLVDPQSHWVPIPGKAYDDLHPAVRSQRSGDRAEHLKNFSLGGGASNVVSINVARENRHLKSLRGE